MHIRKEKNNIFLNQLLPLFLYSNYYNLKGQRKYSNSFKLVIYLESVFNRERIFETSESHFKDFRSPSWSTITHALSPGMNKPKGYL